MRYQLRRSARTTKSTFLSIITVVAFSAISLGSLLPMAIERNAQAATVYRNSFERTADVDGLVPQAPTTVTRTDAPLEASHRSWYATIDGPAFTRWGGYSDTFPTYGYTTSIDVYLDMATATGSNDERFDFSSAINDQSNNHLRDFIFHVGTGAAGEYRVNVSNNAPGNPSAAGYASITEGGWYSLESTFYNNGSDELAVRMTVLNADTNSEIASFDITTTDNIATTVGGNRYGWFTNQRFDPALLAVDDMRLTYNEQPARVYVDDDYTAGAANDGFLFGYNAFDNIEDAAAAVAENGIVRVYDGTYTNVILNGSYADNISILGVGRPDVVGLDLTGATFDGLTIGRFDFLGDANGYGDFSVAITGDGDYQNLSIENSRFDGEDSADRGAIFMNRGFTGFTLHNNVFRNYDNSAGVYSLVFAEAQGADMGEDFVATDNRFIGGNATNSIEAYRWTNPVLTGNEVDATTGRLLVWSNDSDSLETVTISGNTVTVTAGTGIGVYFTPATTATIDGNTIDGAATCLNINSVSDIVVTNNIFANCSTTDLALSETYSTTLGSAVITDNQFSGNPAITNSTAFTVDASKNWWGENANPTGKYTGSIVVTEWCEQAACTSYTDGSTPVSEEEEEPTTTPRETEDTNTTTGGGGQVVATIDTGVTTNSSSNDNQVTQTDDNGEVLASEAEVSGDSTQNNNTNTPSDQPSDQDEQSDRFLGLGWWWIAVLSGVGLLAYYWFVIRKTNA